MIRFLLYLIFLKSISCANNLMPVIEGNSIILGEVRFQVLKPSLIRMEYSENGVFIDSKTVVVVNREFPSVNFTTSTLNDWIEIKTEKVKVLYQMNSGKFTPRNLMVKWLDKNGNEHLWKPDNIPIGAQKGPPYLVGQLDKEHSYIEDSFINRSGYYFYDDSKTPVYSKISGWIYPREDKEIQDWYFFVYDSDYLSMLKDWTELTGPIPMIPKKILGTMFSRWYPYTDKELKEIIGKFRKEKIPFDVLLIDVDWHSEGWSSYDWNKKYFPQPEQFLRWCRQQCVEVSLNVHPGYTRNDEVLPVSDSKYNTVRKLLGIAENEKIIFNLAEKNHADIFMNELHAPFFDTGVGFWWVDGGYGSCDMKGLNSQMWTNKVYYDFTQNYRKNKRSIILTRYGGPGSHRYPFVWTGDIVSNWDELDNCIKITTRGGNVCMPYISHDTGGFIGYKPSPELYLRWVQFSCLSAILRLHSNHGERLPWNYDEKTYKNVVEFIKLRQQFIPYLYTYTHLSHETSYPLIAGTYINYPENDNSYNYENQYFLGKELLVAPVSEPSYNEMVEKEIYLPPGIWVDFFTEDIYEGDRVIFYWCPIERIPVFVKEGSIIPMQENSEYIDEMPYDPLIINIYYGKSGKFRLYEDDGISLNYLKGEYSWTDISFTCREENKNYEIIISSISGKYKKLKERSFIIKLHCFTMPESILFNNIFLDRIEKNDLEQGWFWDEERLQTVIRLKQINTAKQIKIDIRNAGNIEIYKFLKRTIELKKRIRELIEVALEENIKDIDVEKYKSICPARLITSEKVIEEMIFTEESLNNLLFKLLKSNEIEKKIKNKLINILTDTKINIQLISKGDTRKLVMKVNIDYDREIIKNAKIDLSINYPDIWIRKLRMKSKENQETEIFMFDRIKNYFGRWKFEIKANIRSEKINSEITKTVFWQDNSITLFNVAGIFDNTDNKGIKEVYEPEKEIKERNFIDLSTIYYGEDEEVKWKKIPEEAVYCNNLPLYSMTISTFDIYDVYYIDLLKAFDKQIKNRKDFILAYLLTYIFSEQEQDVIFSIGTDDGCVLWLNGKEIYRIENARGAKIGEDKFKVKLNEGWNEILVKLAQVRGDWGLFFQIYDKDMRPFSGYHNIKMKR